MGGKLLGAGGGGFLFFLVSPEHHADVRRAMESLGLVIRNAKFQIAGSTIVHSE